MNFREYLKEAKYGDPVLPLRGYVKGNTIEKNAVSALDFFSGGMGAVIMKNRRTDKMVLVYTAGTGESMYKTYAKRKHNYQDYPETTLEHDQTGRNIGEFDVLGYVNLKDDGAVLKIDGAKASDKISASYTYK